ncbi:MAG: hypothetical protein HFG48_00815 [Bacilli bacterium]|nr:hypothetical protein [Bacilli bacterium]
MTENTLNKTTKKQREKKKMLLFVILTVVICAAITTSFALWQLTLKQTDKNVITTACFNVKMMNESDSITLDNAYPVTDEDGMKNDGYTFSIKNVCSSEAYYQVNLEELTTELKQLSGKYIKVSLNDSKGKNLYNYTSAENTLENALSARKLTTGKLNAEEEVTYTLKLWMDKDTPAIDEVMNASFNSKITIVVSSATDNNQDDTITTETESKNDSVSKDDETITITIKNDKPIIEYSTDGENFIKVPPNTEITFEETFTEEGPHTIYIKDEDGNIKEVIIDTPNLDQTAPSTSVTSKDKDDGSGLELSVKIEDEKSNLSGYQITTDNIEPTEWISISGKDTTITFDAEKDKLYYIWTKDELGNVTSHKYYTDVTAPTLNLSLGTKLTINATDNLSGITAYSVSTKKGSYSWINVENNPLSFTKELEITENGLLYVSVKDYSNNITTKEIDTSLIDVDAPTITSVSGNPNNWTKDNVTLTINGANDTESGLHNEAYSFDNGSTWQKENTKTYTENTSNIIIKVRDNLGNTYTHEVINITKIDKTAPSQSFAIASSTTGENDWYHNISFNINTEDSQSGVKSAKYCVTTSSTCTPTTNATLSNNTFTVNLPENSSAQKICANTTDNANNTSDTTCSTSYKVDTTNPTAKITVNTDLGSIIVSANGSSDAISGLASRYEFSKDGGSTWVSSTTNTYTFTGLDAKTYNIMIKVYDNAGRSSTNKIDTTPGVNGVKYLKSLNRFDLIYDDTSYNNLRYIEDPNNYVIFNDELWRIIGVMNDAGDPNGTIKLIREEPAESYDESYTWGGGGEWATNVGDSALDAYFYESINKSDLSKIYNAKWYTGPIIDHDYHSNANIESHFLFMHEAERVSNSHIINRNVAILYLSDFIFVSEYSREENWLAMKSYSYFTLTQDNEEFVFAIENGSIKNVDQTMEGHSSYLYPCIYLKNEVKFVKGNGTSTNPYLLG